VATQGDPQLVAIPVFVTGSIALGFQLVEYVSGGALGAPLPIVLMATGLLLISTVWAAAAGQSFVAAVTGLFGGFWLSYGTLVLGLQHDWFQIPAADVQRTVALFAISWAAIFFFLTIASLRLPMIYTGIIGLVVVALCLVAAAYLQTPVDTDLLRVAGYVVFGFAALGASVFLTVASVSLGGTAFPPLGRPLVRPPAAGRS
jgi:succinate-acetate transporter protein